MLPKVMLTKTIPQILEDLNGGKITSVDTGGHRIQELIGELSEPYALKKNNAFALRAIKETIQQYMDTQNKCGDLQGMLQWQYIANQVISSPGLNLFRCVHCGEPLLMFMKNEKTLGLAEQSAFSEYKQKRSLAHHGYDYDSMEPSERFMTYLKLTDLKAPVLASDLYQTVCQYSQLTKNNTLLYTAQISVPSGELTFASYFSSIRSSVVEKDIERKAGYSLDIPLGLYNVMQHYAKHDVGFGQMGNTYSKLYYNQLLNKIVLLRTNDREGDEDDLIARALPGYTYCGEISYSARRWMCADTKILKEQYREKFKKATDYDADSNPRITIKVRPGQRNIRHYYAEPLWRELNGAADVGVAKEIQQYVDVQSVISLV